MNAAPPESEAKLAVLRVMRMLEDKSGRNNEVVKQYMAKRWSEKFHGQRDIQTQLMSHLDYALAHTDWHAERLAGDSGAISRWTPYDKPVVAAQKELNKLPVYQRVYQSLKTRALGVLPADLNLRDQVGPTFDQVFRSADDNKLVVPQFLTRYGLQSYFVKQRDELVELTAMDSWVLNLTRSVKYSETDRAEIQRQLIEQYISDYTATWRAGMDNLNIRNFESIGQLTGALEQVISGDQPLQRALTVLRDNTQPGVFSEKLSDKEREEALAEPDYQLLTRLGHEFAPENSTLAVQKDKESTMQAVYQQLTELHRYLLAIQNAPVPGKSALKAVQLRLDQNSSDPIFATRQMAKTLPAPLNRWIGRLQPLETGMQMMRVADSRWPESLQQQQATAQWNETLKIRAQNSPQLRGWLQTRQDLHDFADLVMQREKEGLTLSYIKNVIWQAERGLGQETPLESLLTQYQDARAQQQNTDALEKQINERLDGVLSRWLLLKNNVMQEETTGITPGKELFN